jgi:nicotinamidase-related amidase
MGNLKPPVGPDAVHLCLDMQRLFGPSSPWATPWMTRVMPTVVALVERAPARTIFTRFIPPPSPDQAHGMWCPYFEKWAALTRNNIDPGLLGLMPELAKFVPPARMLDKPVYSAFATGKLHRELRRARINTLIISGGETDVCVLSTILSAIDLGYRIIVVKDALCSSSDETHDALLGLYGRRFDLQIELTNADELLETWKI